MKYLKQIIALLLISFLVNNLPAQSIDSNWPGFRGKDGRGYLDGANTPVSWDISTGDNINWKTRIPGLGHSCPVIWGNKLFITTAVGENDDEYLKVGLYGDIDMADEKGVYKFKVYCLDKNSGEILWERIAHEGIPKSKRHTKSSQANATPSTDGKNLVVCFGSEGLYCYNLEGELLWEKDLGLMNPGPYTEDGVEWGYSSSPVIHDNKIVIQNDSQSGCYIAVYDLKNGDEIWKTTRDELSTWGSPCVYSNNGRTQIIVNGFKHMGAYDFETGEEIWKMSGGGDAPSTTPVVADGLIYINNAHGRYSPIYVVKPEAKGDITLSEGETSNEFIVWNIMRGGAYMQTPLIYKGLYYNLRGNGMLSCMNAKTGEEYYRENLRPMTGMTSSCIASDDKIYCISEKGDVFVIQAGKEFKLLGKNPLNDLHMSTPAISQNAIFFRTQHYVISVGSE